MKSIGLVVFLLVNFLYTFSTHSLSESTVKSITIEKKSITIEKKSITIEKKSITIEKNQLPLRIKILSLLKKKEYLKAVHLMEQEMKKKGDSTKKGYYALLLNQLPVNVSMKKDRHEYGFIAARYAKNIPKNKRMSLWIEAGDGFFKSGQLKTATRCYKEALKLTNGISVEKTKKATVAYIFHKQAWIDINQKKWSRAFDLLVRSLEQRVDRLNDIVLSDIGKTYVESQYFENKPVAFSRLKAVIKTISKAEREILAKGILAGMRRMSKKGIGKMVSALSEDSPLSTEILNLVLSDNSVLDVPSCHLLPWIEKSKTKKLDKELTLSALNSCVRDLTVNNKKRSLKKREQFKQLSDLYIRFERRGIERWPLLIVYEYIGLKDKACNESLHSLTEVTQFMDGRPADVDGKTADEEFKKILSETFRFCEKAKGSVQRMKEALHTVLHSSVVIQKYKNVDGVWENNLFNFLNLKQTRPVTRKSILQAKKKWSEKDLLPALLLSDVDSYQPEEIKAFLNRFGSKPVRGYYVDILIARSEVVKTEELQKFLPLSAVDSYHKILPWFKKVLSDNVNSSQKDQVVNKLLKYFPLKQKDRKTVSLFLALHYLKTDQVPLIAEHWNKLSSVFAKKNMAVELFERSLSNQSSCASESWLRAWDTVKLSPLLKFTYQSCSMIMEEDVPSSGNKIKGEKGEPMVKSQVKDQEVHPALEKRIPFGRLKQPALLRSSALARDFVLLARTREKTLWMEKGISQLNKRPSKMIMDLKQAISFYQRRKWHLKLVAKQMEQLLARQIYLFERELSRLAKSSPYGKTYKELRNIVSQWK